MFDSLAFTRNDKIAYLLNRVKPIKAVRPLLIALVNSSRGSFATVSIEWTLLSYLYNGQQVYEVTLGALNYF